MEVPWRGPRLKSAGRADIMASRILEQGQGMSRPSKLLRQGAAAIGIRLTDAQLERFQRYYDELVDWNSRVNLTAVTGVDEVQTRHFLDSLSVAQAIPERNLESGRFVDVGSGAGFPGLPLKIAFPGLRATLIDSTAKKTAFLSHLVDVLKLDGVDVLTGRAETLAHDPELRGTFDLVVTRAVADMAVLAELTLPFCRIGGLVVAQKSRAIHDEIDRARQAIETVGGELREAIPVHVPGLEKERTLIVFEKVAPTPERYPRRPGIPAKRPILS